MIPALRDRAFSADQARRLPPETVQDLKEAGFFRILRPETFGGYGMPPSALWKVTRHLGRGCGSTAFIISLLGVHAWIAGMFEPEAQQEVFGNCTDTVLSHLSIGVRRTNEVSIKSGGYIVTGSGDRRG